MIALQTDRLKLLPLTLELLRCYLDTPLQLEQALGFAVSREIVTDILARAIMMKNAKMEQGAASQHPWYTYWLIVIKQQPFGAGWQDSRECQMIREKQRSATALIQLTANKVT